MGREFLKPNKWKIILFVVLLILYVFVAIKIPLLYLPGQICQCDNWSCNLKECNNNCGDLILLPVLFVVPYSYQCSTGYSYLGLSGGLEFMVVAVIQLTLIYVISCLFFWIVEKIKNRKIV